MKIITLEELHTLTTRFGMRQIDYLDTRYACPSHGWLIEFGAYLDARRMPYQTEIWDCDDFSTWAREKANEALAESTVTGCGHTFAVAGCLIPLDDPSGPPFSSYEMNLCLCDDGVWYAFEPQTGEITKEQDSGISWTTLRI